MQNKVIAVVWNSNSKPFTYDTVMEDRTGVRRRITSKRYSKDRLIPADWWDAIVGESEFQLSEELAEKNGARIPFS